MGIFDDAVSAGTDEKRDTEAQAAERERRLAEAWRQLTPVFERVGREAAQALGRSGISPTRYVDGPGRSLADTVTRGESFRNVLRSLSKTEMRGWPLSGVDEIGLLPYVPLLVLSDDGRWWACPGSGGYGTATAYPPPCTSGHKETMDFGRASFHFDGTAFRMLKGRTYGTHESLDPRPVAEAFEARVAEWIKVYVTKHSGNA